MNGKVCVVTGASSGIGKAAAVALARLGASWSPSSGGCPVIRGRRRSRSS